MNKNLPLEVNIEFLGRFIEEFRAQPDGEQREPPDYFSTQSVEIIAAYLNMMLMYAACPVDGCGNSIRIYREQVETAVATMNDAELIEFYRPVFKHWKEEVGASE